MVWAVTLLNFCWAKPVGVGSIPRTEAAGCGHRVGVAYLDKGECH